MRLPIMAMIPGGPHIPLTAIHELLTASTHVGFGANEEQERLCRSGMISNPDGQGTIIGNASRHLLMNEERGDGASLTHHFWEQTFQVASKCCRRFIWEAVNNWRPWKIPDRQSV